MASSNDIQRKSFPDAEFRFFIYDPHGEPFSYYRSAADRDAAADDIIQGYLDESWDEEVEQVVAGELTHLCAKVDVAKRPPDDELDEEGHDADGRYWGDFSYYCNYALQLLAGKDGAA